jgi:hypothetical protein
MTANPAATHDVNGNPTYTCPQKFRTRTWVRVFTLTQPTRVVIDVGH